MKRNYPQELDLAIRGSERIPGASKEYRFHPVRRWRFDWAWPEHLLAVEYEGGVFGQGRHTRGKGYSNDCLKYNNAVLMGWKVLRFTLEHINDGTAIKMIEDYFDPENEVRRMRGKGM